ncbi:hypothetical protein TKK_0011486 [Trichogramma kaykai]|uniref:U3 small nucleolar RNA-associated protein 13 C-terminal domain-containing protein n=1 Tax=Trichogramma kaykai TaxID=54128 RepID=A0ABD2WRC6_9HYME
MDNRQLKESFDIETKVEAFYTGGNVKWSDDGEHLFCHNYDHVVALSLSKNTRVEIGIENKSETDDINEDPVTCFTASDDGESVITYHKSTLFRYYKVQEPKTPVKLWKSLHNPVVSMAIMKMGDALNVASGGVDGSIRLWDIEKHACTFSLKGAQGVIGVILYQFCKLLSESPLLFAVGDDHIIRGWNTQTGKNDITLEGHFSQVTSLSFHEDGKHAVSSGRDKVLILWDLQKQKALRTWPVFENIEGIFIIPNESDFPGRDKKKKSDIFVSSAGGHGVVKIWDMHLGKKVHQQTNSLIPPAQYEEGLAVTQLLYNKESNSILMVSTSHNIFTYTLDKFEIKKQLCGYLDEIVDIAFLGTLDTHIVVAANTCDLILFEIETMKCQILQGHKDNLLSVATTSANRNLLISSDKAKSIRLWLMDEKTKVVSCIGERNEHTAAVISVAISQATASFFVSVGKDSCLKLWDLPEKLENLDATSYNSPNTICAHQQQEITCVDISPDNKIIATGSLDKTAKLWTSDKLQLLGTLKGHRRGIHCVRFSPIDQVLATASSDCNIKLWSLSELNCVKTFEGNEAGVMKIQFASCGMQLISSAINGLIKFWSVKTSECNLTLEGHKGKVWSIQMNHNETRLVSADIDSRFILWRDTTQEKKELELAQKEERMQDEQNLSNALKADKLLKALRLALKCQKPHTVLKIIEAIVKKGEEKLDRTICKLSPEHQVELLHNAIAWNTNARNYHVAQIVIYHVLKKVGINNVEKDVRETLRSLIPYTERHFRRVTRVFKDLHLLRYTVTQMTTNVEDDDDDDDDNMEL